LSSPRLRLALTRLAQQDLQDLLQFSLETWGSEQLDRYADALLAGLTRLLDFPGIGKTRDDLIEGARMYAIEQHVVIYSVRGRTLRVLRILHRRMDIARAFRGKV
jgi:toxin ParE1/3/4